MLCSVINTILYKTVSFLFINKYKKVFALIDLYKRDKAAVGATSPRKYNFNYR